MTITPEQKAEILRLHHAEKWPVNTIAIQLSVHHGVVERVLRQEGIARSARRRASRLDKYVPFIQESFKRYPRLCASRLFQMCIERGYKGSESHFRHAVRAYRPKKSAEAYLRLRTLPGEQAQVDWGDFGTIEIGRAQRRLSAFVMVLSYSRRIFLRFYLNLKTETFLAGHQEAFQRWNGSVRVVLYDNLKSCVIERQGDAIRFHSVLLDFAAHYRYEPRPVAVARGNEKAYASHCTSSVRLSGTFR